MASIIQGPSGQAPHARVTIREQILKDGDGVAIRKPQICRVVPKSLGGEATERGIAAELYAGHPERGLCYPSIGNAHQLIEGLAVDRFTGRVEGGEGTKRDPRPARPFDPQRGINVLGLYGSS